jgi:hypothetical protein
MRSLISTPLDNRETQGISEAHIRESGVRFLLGNKLVLHVFRNLAYNPAVTNIAIESIFIRGAAAEAADQSKEL